MRVPSFDMFWPMPVVVLLLLLPTVTTAHALPTNGTALTVALAHNSPGEQKTRADPILTLNRRSTGLGLLSAYLHEQLHWYEDMHARQVAAAEAIFERRYPDLPIGYPEGAVSLESNYLHIITCFSELQAMKRLVGNTAVYTTTRSVARNHYRSICALVWRTSQLSARS